MRWNPGNQSVRRKRVDNKPWQRRRIRRRRGCCLEHRTACCGLYLKPEHVTLTPRAMSFPTALSTLYSLGASAVPTGTVI